MCVIFSHYVIFFRSEVYSQPLCLVPGSNFGGIVKVFRGNNQVPDQLEVSFTLDTIEEWIDNYNVKESCTCTWAEADPDNCSCGLVAVELRVRQDVHSSFTECDTMFPRNSVVEVRVNAGRIRAIFQTVNRHLSFDCPCDNFRCHPQLGFARDSLTLPDAFFSDVSSSSDESFELSSEFVDR